MSLTLTYPFTTSGNYTYDSDDIEVTGGKAQLKNLETATDSTEDFEDTDGLTFSDDTRIEITGGAAALKLIDLEGQTFNEDFADDTDFTYDSNDGEFSGGQYQQKDTRPTDATFYASFTNNINGSWGGGVLTGTAIGGASVSGGILHLDQSDTRYVTFPIADNFTSLNSGCVRFRLIPNYSGSPATNQWFFALGTLGNTNRLDVFHHSSGGLVIRVYDSAGATIINNTLGTWSPSSGTEYELEYNYDITTGATRLFVDGNQFGSTDTNTGTRTLASLTDIRLGTNSGATLTSNFDINDIIIFSTIQHTTNYTPDWSGLNETPYVSDMITLPTFTYSGCGSIQAFTTFSTTDTNSPRYIINDQYWTGAAWAASSDTWATASTEADINTNIGTLAALDSFDVKMVTNGGAVQMACSDLTIGYTGQVYLTLNPTVSVDAAITATVTSQAVTAWNSFTATVSEPGSDAVKFILSDDDGSTWKYYSGGWVASDASYSQSNTATEVNTNIADFPKTTDGMKIRIFLHSDDGSTTPNISNLVVNYDDYIFATDNPTITPTSTTNVEDLVSFAATVTEAGSDAVKFIMEIGGTNYWWSGSAWAESDGTYSQSNTAADINTNIGSLSDNKVAFRPVIFLHSNDGSTTPDIDIITISYDFYGGDPSATSKCIVFGYIFDHEDNAMANVGVSAVLTANVIYNSEKHLLKTLKTSTTTDSAGYWELKLTENANMTPSGTKYTFTFTDGNDVYSEDKTVPNETTKNYALLS